MDLADWFKGFEKGITKLPEAQRETFFRECGKNCVQCGTLQIYKDLYEQAAGDFDQFFANQKYFAINFIRLWKQQKKFLSKILILKWNILTSKNLKMFYVLFLP